MRLGGVLGAQEEELTREGSSYAVGRWQSWDSDTLDFSQAALSDPEPLPPIVPKCSPSLPYRNKSAISAPCLCRESGMPQARM